MDGSGKAPPEALTTEAPASPSRDKERTLPGTVRVTIDAGTRFSSTFGKKSTSDEATPSSISGRTLRPPPRIGRYVILRELGRGGMGITYIAYDESLRREVVVKLVRQDEDHEKAQLRLQREAQAMAQLSHPNTVAVYEVGTQRDRVFIAMERILGKTMASWFDEGEHPWQEALDIMRQAGAGLAAAHAAGLVHRDFKPANIIIGDDGRVRVLDFGMVRMRENAEQELEELLTTSNEGNSLAYLDDEDSEASIDLTLTGSFLGTPQYASPEQFRGLVADEQSDQFSFCVTLYRALYNNRPFKGKKLGALAKEVVSGRIRKPSRETPVPSWLWPIVLRGLDPNPAKRWPSMQALLVELTKDPQARRRRWLTGAGLAAGVATAFLAGSRLLPRSTEARLCQNAAAHLSGTWDEATRVQLERAMLSSGLPRAFETWSRTRVALNAYAERWVDTYEASCSTFLQRGETDILAESMRCLTERRESLAGLVEALGRITPETMRQAAPAASSLPRINVCRDPSYLKAQVKPPDDPVVINKVEAVRANLVRAVELERVGQLEAADRLLDEAVEDSRRIDYPPLRAEVLLHRGHLESVLGRFVLAQDTLRNAYVTARRANMHAIAGRAATRLTFLTGYKLAEPKDGELWAKMALLELEEHGTDEDRALLERRRGAVAIAASDFRRAVSSCRASLRLLLRSLDESHPEVITARQNLGISLLKLGRYDEAELELRQTVEAWRNAFGPDDVRLPLYVLPHARALARLGQRQEALDRAREYLVLFQDGFGQAHPRSVRYQIGIGRTLLELGDPQAVIQVVSEAQKLSHRTIGPNHPSSLEAMLVIAHAHALLEAWDLAREGYEEVLRNPRTDTATEVGALIGMAELHLTHGRPNEALPLAQQAIHRRLEKPGSPEQLGQAGFIIARSMHALGMGGNEPIGLAEQALEDFQAIPGTGFESSIAQIKAWLDSVPRGEP